MDFSKAENINTLWGRLVVEELIRNGVEHFCIAPGSRSTPLAAAVALNRRATSFVHFDERGLGFFALGLVSALRKPVTIITTSGTAVANLLPAVIETSKKKLPLIVLTADRPPELQKTGADQTIDQNGIFGNYVKWQFNLPCPTEEIKPELVLTTIDQAVYQARSATSGAVHLNCMFREPLAPIGQSKNFSKYVINLSRWIQNLTPYTSYANPLTTTDFLTSNLQKSLFQIKNGLIAVGKLNSKEEQDSVLKFARKFNWPIFADISSGLRLQEDNHIIHYYDQLLLSKKITKEFLPDGIVHLGGRMCSKRFYEFVDKIKPKTYISVLNHPLRSDPLHAVTHRVQSLVGDFCPAITNNVGQRDKNPQLERLKILSEKSGRAIDQFLKKQKTLNEISVARLVSENLPSDSGLFLASSMPIRDMDMYAMPAHGKVTIGSNRGASGIDGTIATAIGFAKALSKPTTLVIGDLAFLHDINSLSLLKNSNKPFVIIVLNNNGGGIFSFLPVSKRKDIFEKFFGTPHDFHFEKMSQAFGLKYLSVETPQEFATVYRNAFSKNEKVVIEIPSLRAQNTKIHRDLQAKVTVLNSSSKKG